MPDLDYDANEMRAAMKKVQDTKNDLMRQRPLVHRLPRVQRPGDSPETKLFHDTLTKETLPHAIKRHDDAVKLCDDTLAGLIAVDRQYNNGELANELGFNKIKTD
jgi:hypothetical protein